MEPLGQTTSLPMWPRKWTKVRASGRGGCVSTAACALGDTCPVRLQVCGWCRGSLFAGTLCHVQESAATHSMMCLAQQRLETELTAAGRQLNDISMMTTDTVLRRP